jgi:hypothetical protein
MLKKQLLKNMVAIKSFGILSSGVRICFPVWNQICLCIRGFNVYKDYQLCFWGIVLSFIYVLHFILFWFCTVHIVGCSLFVKQYVCRMIFCVEMVYVCGVFRLK